MKTLRVLGWLLLAGAAVALGEDIVRSVRAGTIETQPIGALWYALSPGSLIRAQAAVQAYIHPVAWSRGIFPLLTMPAWLPAGFLGAIALLLARRGRRRH